MLGSQASNASAVAQNAEIDAQLQMLHLPLEPFDPREIDEQIARERSDHAEYIYNFRVHVCPAYMEGNCPNDAYSCFQTHARLPRRRSVEGCGMMHVRCI
jgi:hypothetical protein